MPTGRLSAGILLFDITRGGLRVLIGHPGGPFWANRQEGAWSIPKGLVEPGEDALATALREFAEETGHEAPTGRRLDLGEATLRSGKRVVAWAVAGWIDAEDAAANPVRMEWPRGSGRFIEFPEIDEFRWCSVAEAGRLLNPRQVVFLDRLQKTLDHVE